MAGYSVFREFRAFGRSRKPPKAPIYSRKPIRGSGGWPPSRVTLVATPTNSLNSGCGLLGRDRNSG